MIISRGNYTRVAQALLSSSDAAYLSVPANLVDGVPSSQCALQWPSGLQSTSVYVHMPWRMVPAPAAECRIFALLGLDGIPAGATVELYGGATAVPATLLAATTTVTLPEGDVGAWIVREPGAGWIYEYFAWRVYNDVGGTSPIVASAVVYIGELYASPAWDWPINEISDQPVDQALTSTSAGGASRRVRQPAYRMLDCNVVPKAWDAAALDPVNGLQAFQYDVLDQDVIAVIPRPRWPPGGPISDAAVRACARLGVLSRIGPLASNAGTDRWPLALSVQQTL